EERIPHETHHEATDGESRLGNHGIVIDEIVVLDRDPRRNYRAPWTDRAQIEDRFGLFGGRRSGLGVGGLHGSHLPSGCDAAEWVTWSGFGRPSGLGPMSYAPFGARAYRLLGFAFGGAR